MFNANPNSRLNIKIKGQIAGAPVTGGVIGPMTKKGTRWVSMFHKKGGCYSLGEITQSGQFIQEGNDPDNLIIAQAIINAANEQYS